MMNLNSSFKGEIEEAFPVPGSIIDAYIPRGEQRCVHAGLEATTQRKKWTNEYYGVCVCVFYIVRTTILSLPTK